MFCFVQNGKYIIIVAIKGRSIAPDNLQCLLRELEVDDFARFLAGVVYPLFLDIGVFQQGYIREIDSCAQIAEYKNISTETGVEVSVR